MITPGSIDLHTPDSTCVASVQIQWTEGIAYPTGSSAEISDPNSSDATTDGFVSALTWTHIFYYDESKLVSPVTLTTLKWTAPYTFTVRIQYKYKKKKTDNTPVVVMYETKYTIPEFYRMDSLS